MIKNQINKSYDNVVQETLIAARMLISDKSSWGQFGFSGTTKDDDNNINEDVVPSHPSAACWCSYGAIQAFSPDDKVKDQCADILFIAADILGIDDTLNRYEAEYVEDISEVVETDSAVFEVNDGNDHRTVLKVFDAAIALCEF